MSVARNIDAEKAAISLLSRAPLSLIDLPWRDELFFSSDLKLMFQVLVSAIEANEPTDYTAITAKLIASGQLKDAGGDGNIYEVFDFVKANPFAKPNSEIIRDQLRYYFLLLSQALVYRNLHAVITEAHVQLEDMTLPVNEFVDQVNKAAELPASKEEVPLRQQLNELIAELEKVSEDEKFSFSLPGLDKHIGGGIHRGEMCVIGGETSSGKSILLLMAALSALQEGRSVAIFSLEMPAKDVLRRLAANMAGVPIKGILEKPTQYEFSKASESLRRMFEFKLTIRDNVARIQEIEFDARRLVALGKADVVIIDYAQLIENSAADNREQAISESTRKLKNLALQSNCAVFTASQVNDDGKLRESRAIGQHADLVIFIEDENLKIGKNRRGPRHVTVNTTLRGEISRFEDDDISD